MCACARRCLRPALLAALPVVAAAHAAPAAQQDFLARDLNATDRIIVRLRAPAIATQTLHQRLGQLAGTRLAVQRAASHATWIYRLPAHMPLPYVETITRNISRDANVLMQNRMPGCGWPR